jgi:hypothetical protein
VLDIELILAVRPLAQGLLGDHRIANFQHRRSIIGELNMNPMHFRMIFLAGSLGAENIVMTPYKMI